MPTTPTGPFSLPLFHFRRLMAASAAWQSWTQSANSTEAARRIHYFDLPAAEDHNAHSGSELEILRPLAVVSYISSEDLIVRGGAPSQHTRIAGGALLTFIDRGQLFVGIEADVPPLSLVDGESTDALIEFLNRAGGVYADVLRLSGTDDYLAIREIAFSDPIRIQFSGSHSQGDHIKMLWRVQYGNFG